MRINAFYIILLYQNVYFRESPFSEELVCIAFSPSTENNRYFWRKVFILSFTLSTVTLQYRQPLIVKTNQNVKFTWWYFIIRIKF